MARIRIFVIFVLAISAGGALAYGTYNYLQNAPRAAAATPTRTVVVANADLQLGTELRADDLKAIDWPASAVPAGAFTTPAEIVGRGLIAPVVQNEPILDAKLASKEAGVGLPPAIPQGMRAVSVRVNEVIGVAGYVLPGTHVDVLATANPTEQRADITTKLVLSNVQVLTAGTKLEQSGDKGKPVQVTVVTLLVNPEQAERLTLASTEGKIQLALRNPLDPSAPTTPGVRPAVLLASGSVARPVAKTASRSTKKAATAAAPAPEPIATVEIIRGDKRAVEAVK
ncbi:MAG: Flp pilus assembly protein CpaB [Bacteroidales bacterium]